MWCWCWVARVPDLVAGVLAGVLVARLVLVLSVGSAEVAAGAKAAVDGPVGVEQNLPAQAASC